MQHRINQLREYGIGFMVTALVSYSRQALMTSQLVNPKWSFLIHELPARLLRTNRNRRVVAHYKLLGGYPLVVDHSSTSADVAIICEMFHGQQYAIPNEVQAALARHPLRVLDIGGNVGYFALWTHIYLPDSSVTAIEADPQNARRFDETLRLLDRGDWQLIQAFAGTNSGTVRFAAGKGVLSAKSQDGSGIDVPSVDILPYMENADLIKMDIEGGEWEILSDPRFAHLRHKAIVLEYHADFCPAPDARTEVLRIAEECGFSVAEGVHGGKILWLYKL